MADWEISVQVESGAIQGGMSFVQTKQCPIPADLVPIPRPWIGHTGWIKKQLDWHLMLKLTEHFPQWSFVFVGVRSPHPEILPLLDALAERDNVHFLRSEVY